MRRMIYAVGMLLALASQAAAECDSSVPQQTIDARTGTRKYTYRRCHFEDEHNEMVQQLWDNLGVSQSCITLLSPGATPDDIPFFIATAGVEVVSISCRVVGTCATPPTFDVTDSAGDIIAPASTVTCATGTTDATPQSTTADADRDDIAAGGSPRLDITNTPSCDLAQVCIKVKATLE